MISKGIHSYHISSYLSRSYIIALGMVKWCIGRKKCWNFSYIVYYFLSAMTFSQTPAWVVAVLSFPLFSSYGPCVPWCHTTSHDLVLVCGRRGFTQDGVTLSLSSTLWNCYCYYCWLCMEMLGIVWQVGSTNKTLQEKRGIHIAHTPLYFLAVLLHPKVVTLGGVWWIKERISTQEDAKEVRHNIMMTVSRQLSLSSCFVSIFYCFMKKGEK